MKYSILPFGSSDLSPSGEKGLAVHPLTNLETPRIYKVIETWKMKSYQLCQPYAHMYTTLKTPLSLVDNTYLID